MNIRTHLFVFCNVTPNLKTGSDIQVGHTDPYLPDYVVS